jgi:hypothetical protein
VARRKRRGVTGRGPGVSIVEKEEGGRNGVLTQRVHRDRQGFVRRSLQGLLGADAETGCDQGCVFSPSLFPSALSSRRSATYGGAELVTVIDLEDAEDEIEDIQVRLCLPCLPSFSLLGIDPTTQQSEISILSSLDSPFVTRYYGSWLRNTELWIVMEYLQGAPLPLPSFPSLTDWTMSRWIVRGLVEGWSVQGGVYRDRHEGVVEGLGVLAWGGEVASGYQGCVFSLSLLFLFLFLRRGGY